MKLSVALLVSEQTSSDASNVQCDASRRAGSAGSQRLWLTHMAKGRT